MPDPYAPAESVNDWLKNAPDPLKANPAADPYASDASVGDWLAAGEIAATKQLELSNNLATKRDPNTVARVWKLRAKTGLPGEMIERNLDQVEQDVKAKDFDAYQYRRTSPTVAAWIAEHPDHASIAREDIDRLGVFESIWKSVQFERGAREAQVGRLYFQQQNIERSGQRDPALEAQIKEVERQLALEPEGGGFLLETLQLSSSILGQVASSLGASVDEALIGAAGGAVAGAAASAPTLGTAAPVTATAGAVAGFGVGLGTGLFTDSAKIIAGHSYRQIRQIRGENGEQVDPQTAANISLGVGVLGGALEVFGAKLALAPFKSAANKFVAQASVDALAYPTSRQAIAQFGRDWATAVGGEVATETLQEVVAIAGEEMAKLATSGEFETLANDPELRAATLARILETAGKTLQGMAPLGLPGAGVNFAANMRAAREAEKRAEFFKQAGESIQAMEMAKKSPEAMEDVADRLAQDGAPSTIYFSVDTWHQYWEAKKVDPRAMAERLGADPKIYDQATETGGDVQIPSAKFLALVGPTQHYNALLPEMRTGAGQMSQREAKEFLAQAEEQRKLAEETPEQKAAREVEESTEQVRAQVEKQLTDIGYSPEVAGRDAQVMASFIRTQSALAGVSPTELLSRYGLRIEREGMDTATPPEGTVVQNQMPPLDAEGVAVEQRFAERLAMPDAEQAYAALPDSLGGKSLNVDLVRELSADFTASKESRGRFAPATHEPASKFIKDQYKKRLAATPTGPVMFLAGGGGSGKSTVQNGVAVNLRDAAEIIRDGVMSDATKAIRYMDEALATERPVEFVYVHLPFREAVRRARKRQATEGRSVPLDVLAEAHAGAQDALFKIAEHYAGNPAVTIRVFDNSGSTPREISVAELATQRYDQDGKGVDATAARLLQEVSDEVQPRPGPDDGRGMGGVPQGQPDPAGSTGPAGPGELGQVPGEGEGQQAGADQAVLNQDERGSFQITPDRKVLIRLAKSSDLSTFLHESGHFFIEVLADLANAEGANPQLKQDWQTIVGWWKSHGKQMRGDAVRLAERGGASNETLAAIRDMSDEDIANVADNFHQRQKGARKWVRSAMHEYWARGTEAYFMEGKAPSAELRGVFDRFRLWLLDVYRAVKAGITDAAGALRVQLNDDVRQVMDRMLASQEAIEQAKAEGNVQPLFLTPEQAGMTAEEFAPYQKTVQEASAKAQTDLQLKLIRQFNNESKAWWKEQKAKISAEVVAEVNQAKEQIALAVLLTGKMPDGSELPENLRPVKIQRNTLTPEQYKALPKGVAEDTGVSAQMAAELFGYVTVEEMVGALSTARPADELIEAETNRRMKQRHGDLMIDRDKLAEAARQEVMGDSREKVILAEMRALRRLQRAAEPIVRQQERAAKAEQAKARAEMFDRLPNLADVHREARTRVMALQYKNLQPNNYWIAARRASAEAFRASAMGKHDVALNAKTRELMALAYYRASVEARAEADRHVKYLRGFNKDSARAALGKAGKEYLDQVDNLLDRFDLRKLTAKERENRKQALAEFIREQQDQGKTFGENMAIPDLFLDEAYRKAYTDLTADEITALYESVKNIASIASLQNRMFATHKAITREEVKAKLIDSAQANNDRKKPGAFSEASENRREKRVNLIRSLDASLIKAEQLVDWLDGGEVSGPWREFLFEGASRAQASKMDYNKRITAKVVQAISKMPEKIRKRMMDPVAIPGVNVRMVRADLLFFAFQAGNESNYQKFLRSRTMGIDWTEAMVRNALDQLSAEEIGVVNDIVDTMESVWPDISALQERLTGLPPEKVEARPVTVQNGTIKGGYFPLMYEADKSRAGDLQLADAFRIGDGSLHNAGAAKATTPKGHLQKRIEDFTAPFDTNWLTRLPSQIDGVITDLTHREWLIDAHNILNDQRVKDVIIDRLGSEYLRTFRDWVRSVVNDRGYGGVESTRTWMGFFERLRYNVMIAGMGFKVSTFFSQAAGYAASIETLTGQYGKGVKRALAGAAFDLISAPVQNYRMITEKSGEMRHRIQTRDADLGAKLRLLEGRTDALAQVQDASLRMIVLGDFMVSFPTWLAAYRLELAKSNNESLAVQAGDRAVRMSQGSGGGKDLAGVVADKRSFLRLMTMYYTPFSALYSRLRDIKHTASKKPAMQTFARLFWGWWIASLAGELLAGRGPEDDGDDEALDDWARWAAGTIAFYPTITVPWLRDVANAAAGDYGYTFTPISAVGKELGKTGKQVGETAEALLTGEDPELGKLAEDTFKAAKYLVGLPSGQVEITGEYLLDMWNEEEDPEGMWEFMHDLLFRRPKQ